MREEPVLVMRRAEGRDRDVANAEIHGASGEDGSQVHEALASLSGATVELLRDVITYFIAVAANTYATMHYDVSPEGPRTRRQDFHTLLQYAIGHPPPPCVPQGDRAPLGSCQVDRDAVRHRDREQHSRLPGGMAIHALEHQPPRWPSFVPAHVGAVHLVSQHEGRESRLERLADGPPARHHRASRLFAPQAEGEASVPRGDPRHETVAVGPFAQLESRDGRITHR